MPIETEIKIPVDDLARIESRLRELGAELLGEFLQGDVFMDSRDHRLLEKDQGLRLRTLERIDHHDQDRQYVLTYKGARQKSSVKQREEIEVQVADPQATIDLLDRLGYSLMLYMQKRRRRYRLDGCNVELDTLPLLGNFVEIEGRREEAIHRVVKKLGLDSSQGITHSYACLLMAEARKRGLPTEPGRFVLETP